MRSRFLLCILAALAPLVAGAAHAADPSGTSSFREESPRAILRVAPDRPPDAAPGDTATVVVRARVGTDGHVNDTRVLRSVPGFDEAALDAVRLWEFEPARSDGEPVSAWVTIPIHFTAAPPDTATAPPRSSDQASERDGIPVPPSARAGPGASLADLVSALRARGAVEPSRDDALLREQIVREALKLAQPPPIPRSARAAFERATRETPRRRAAADPLQLLSSVLLEAPWWPEPYREIAAVQEKRGHVENAMICLELYLVAKPDARDWRDVRRRIWKLASYAGGSQ